jgi:ribosomal protein L29
MAIAAKAPKKEVAIVDAEPKKPEASKAAKAETKKAYTLADVKTVQKEYAELQMKVVTGNEKNSSQLKKMRKEIARGLTYLNTNK